MEGGVLPATGQALSILAMTATTTAAATVAAQAWAAVAGRQAYHTLTAAAPHVLPGAATMVPHLNPHPVLAPYSPPRKHTAGQSNSIFLNH